MSKIYFNGANIKFQPKDIWIGIYWDSQSRPYYDADKDKLDRWTTLQVYICLVPMFPIKLYFSWITKSLDAKILRSIYG